MTRAPSTAVAHLFRRVAVPLGCYYVVTLALPLANGAAQSGAAFVHHALVVLVVPPILIVCAYAIRQAARMLATLWPGGQQHRRGFEVDLRSR